MIEIGIGRQARETLQPDERQITKEELEKILKEHMLWLGTNLKFGTFIEGVNLKGADLRDTILEGAKVSKKQLS